MDKLNKKAFPKFAPKKSNTPYIFIILKKCRDYNISYEMMCRLNYHDLQYMIIEYDIDTLRKYLKDLERMRQQRQGVEIVDATNEDVLAFHSRGRGRSDLY